MIIYDNSAWLKAVFTWIGTVWPQIYMPFVILAIYAGMSFGAVEYVHHNFGVVGHTVLGSTMSFLLIFRANQAYLRYQDGRTFVSICFGDIRDFLMLSLLHMAGGEFTQRCMNMDHGNHRSHIDDNDRAATACRVKLVRLGVALSVLVKLHTRISYDGYCFGRISRDTKWKVDWDRLRLRQLLTDSEFEVIDRCIGIIDENSMNSLDDLARQFGDGAVDPPDDWPDEFEVVMQPAARASMVCVYFIRETLCTAMNDYTNVCPWGIKERFVAVLFDLLRTTQLSIEMLDQIITTPLPFPYACLCKTLLGVYLFAIPFFVDYKIGAFGSFIIPVTVCLVLLGIDAISTELENPFGDDDNDLDLIELVSMLESEALQMLTLTGDTDARDCFCWRRLLPSVTSCKPVRRQLAVVELAADEMVISGALGTPLSSAGR